MLSVLPESKTTISEAHDALLRVVSIVLSAFFVINITLRLFPIIFKKAFQEIYHNRFL